MYVYVIHMRPLSQSWCMSYGKVLFVWLNFKLIRKLCRTLEKKRRRRKVLFILKREACLMGKSQLHDVLFYNLPNWIDVGLLLVMCVHVLTLIKVLCVRTKYVRTRVPSSLNTFCTRSIVSLLCKICQWCLCRVLRAFGQIKFSAYENKWRLQSMLVQSSLSTRRRIRVD